MEQSPKVQNKITKILEILEYIECIPTKYLKHMESTDGLYEMRITLGSDIFCVFCFFDKGRLVDLLPSVCFLGHQERGFGSGYSRDSEKDAENP